MHTLEHPAPAGVGVLGVDAGGFLTQPPGAGGFFRS